MGSAIEAVRKHCTECVGSQSMREVEYCGGEFIYNTGEPCPLFPFRLGRGRVPLKLIRHECLGCNGGQKGVRECPSLQCNLYPFRMGKNPNIQLSDAEVKRRSELLRKARQKRAVSQTFWTSERVS